MIKEIFKKLFSKNKKIDTCQPEERKLFKYSEDDILEILIEHLAQQNSYGTFNSKAKLIGKPGKDLRLIAVIGNMDDFDINKIDLDNLDEKLSFNGSHLSIDIEKKEN